MSVVLRGRLLRLALACFLSATCVACFDEPRVVLDAGIGGEQDSGEDDATIGDRRACSGAMDGLACGDGRHCIDGVCAFNRCGDGVVTGAEQCDDGNLNLGDDCTPSCRAIVPVCGDGYAGLGEQCDDGNRDDDDDCSNACVSRVPPPIPVDPLTASCPTLTRWDVIPYAGDDERLEGSYFTIEAEFGIAPAYWQWSSEGGQIFVTREKPFVAGFHCAAPGAQVIALFTAAPNCVAVAHQAHVTCRD